MPLSTVELLDFWGKLGTGRRTYWRTLTPGCSCRATNMSVSRLSGLPALQIRSHSKKWWPLSPHQINGELIVSIWGQIIPYRGTETGKALNAGAAIYRHLKKKKKKPLVAMMCFSDDTWWTKAKEMKAACVHSAEPWSLLTFALLHLLQVYLPAVLHTLLIHPPHPPSPLLQLPRISTYHPHTCNSFFFSTHIHFI